MRHQPSQRRTKVFGRHTSDACASRDVFSRVGKQRPPSRVRTLVSMKLAELPVNVDENPLRAAVRHAGARLAQGSAPVPADNGDTRSKLDRSAPSDCGNVDRHGCRVGFFRLMPSGAGTDDPRVALIGAGAGAWGGLMRQLCNRYEQKKRSGRQKIGIVAGAVGLVVLPVLACYGAGVEIVLIAPGIQTVAYRSLVWPWPLAVLGPSLLATLSARGDRSSRSGGTPLKGAYPRPKCG